MSVIGKKQLLDTLKLQKVDENQLVTWGDHLNFSPPLTSLSFHIDRQRDVNISVPVSNKDIAYLKRTSKHATISKGFDMKMNASTECSLKIHEQEITIQPADSFLHTVIPTLAKVVTQKLLGFEVKELDSMVGIHLSKLLIVEKGQQVKLYSESKSKSGTYAIMVMTIPVKGGYKGGKINVEHNGETKSFQFENESCRHLSLVAFNSGCSHELEPVNSGWMLAMVFNLVWLDACKAIDSPLEFPAFLYTLKKLKESLYSWASPQPKNKEISAERTHHLPPSNLKLCSKKQNEISEEKMEIDSGDTDIAFHSNIASPHLIQPENTFLLPDNSDKELLLIYPLDGKYDIADLSSEILLGSDRLVYHLFQTVSFLDVHFALVSQLVGIDKKHDDIDSDTTERNIQISKWINSSSSVPMTKLLLLDASQLVGNFSRIQNAAQGQDEDCVIYYHSCLIIQPRHQSIFHACRYHFNDVLDYLELHQSRIKEAAVSNPRPYGNEQRQLEWNLKYVIAFCRQEPSLALIDPDSETNDRSVRLLKMCIELKAKEEGIELLDLLGITNNQNPVKHPENSSTNDLPDLKSQGIRDRAKVIADFVAYVADWKTCADPVLKLISPSLIFHQLEGFTSLAQYFEERNIFEGAREVADRVSFIIDKLDGPMTNRLSDYQIGCFIHLIVTFEEIRMTSNPDRTHSVVKMFTRLEIPRQCCFMRACQESNFMSQHVWSRSSRKIFQQICSSLAFDDRLHPSSFDFHSVSFPIIKNFIQLGEEDLVRKLVDKICLCHADTFGDNSDCSAGLLLDSILSSPYEIMYVYFISPSGRAAIKILQDAGIRQVGRIAFCHPKTPALASVQMIPTTSTFLQNSVDDLVESWMSEIFRRIHRKNKNTLCPDAMEECRKSSVGLVRLIVDTCVEIWVHNICRRLDVLNLGICKRLLSSTDPSEDDILAQDSLHDEINNCIQLYMRNEMGRYPAEHSNKIFLPFIRQMCTRRLSQLLVSIQKMEAKEKRSLKEYPTCFELCCFIANEFVTREDLNILFESPDELVDVIASLFWLSDDSSLFSFTRQIMSLSPSIKSDVFSKVGSDFRTVLNQQISQLEIIQQSGTATGVLGQLEKLRSLQLIFQESKASSTLVIDEDVDMA